MSRLYRDLADWWPLVSVPADYEEEARVYADAIDMLRKAADTAFVHCEPGGVALFVPDDLRESWCPSTSHGGHDGEDGRALRYLEWSWDPDPEARRLGDAP